MLIDVEAERVAQRGGAATKQVETRLSPRMSMWPQPLFTRPPCTDVKNPCQKNKNLRACNAEFLLLEQPFLEEEPQSLKGKLRAIWPRRATGQELPLRTPPQ
jgi:hypothetical protein